MLVNGFPLVCPHCRGRSFQHKRIMLNTKGMTFFDLDWLNKDADTFACTGCGRIEWFTGATVSEDGEEPGDRDCPRCGYFIAAGKAFCPNCSVAS